MTLSVSYWLQGVNRIYLILHLLARHSLFFLIRASVKLLNLLLQKRVGASPLPKLRGVRIKICGGKLVRVVVGGEVLV